jgi:hypothetical protein
MRGSDKTGRLRGCVPVTQARHRDEDMYRRYAVGLYRQALFGALAQVRAGGAPEIHPTSLVRAALRRLTTSPAATKGQQENDAETRLCHANPYRGHGNHAGPDGAQIVAGRPALPGDEKNVTAS